MAMTIIDVRLLYFLLLLQFSDNELFNVYAFKFHHSTHLQGLGACSTRTSSRHLMLNDEEQCYTTTCCNKKWRRRYTRKKHKLMGEYYALSSYRLAMPSSLSSLSSKTSSYTDEFGKKKKNKVDIQGELIGSNGRIGSFLLRATCAAPAIGIGTNATHNNKEFAIKVVAKGETPGLASPVNTPIYVAIPATQVTSVIEQTTESRRQDLVFVTNGIPSDFIQCFENLNKRNHHDIIKDINNDDAMTITTTVPHFGVLKVGADPISNKLSPPTFIYGKHSAKLQSILESHDLNVKVTSNLMEIDAAAIRKLTWVSAMWLLCHDHHNYHSHCNSDDEKYSINVTQVHETKNEQLYELVRNELYPAALELLQRYHEDEIKNTHDARKIMGSIQDVMSYLESYSFSMPEAIPNKDLAIDEIDHRNGILLSTSVDQPLHKALIERVTHVV